MPHVLNRPRILITLLICALVVSLVTLIHPVARAMAGSSAGPQPGHVVPAAERSSLPGGLHPSDGLVVQSGGLRTLRVDGSAGHVLDVPDAAEHPDWSPDGQRVTFEVDFSSIWVASAQGTRAHAVFTCKAPCVQVSQPAWSPDGHNLAFGMVESQDGENTSRTAVVTLDVSSGAWRRVLTDRTGLIWFYGPRWSPSGRQLVVEADTWASRALSEDVRTKLELVVVASAGGRGRTVAQNLEYPDWSPRGDLLVGVKDDNLVVLRPDGSHRRPITGFDGIREHAIQPTFTPSGTAVVFTYVTGEFGVDDFPTAGVVSVTGSGFTTIGGGGLITHPRIRP